MFLLDHYLNPPMLTGDLPGIGGRIKVELEDFQVEEIPAYLPGGQGAFLYLLLEKRDMGAEYFTRQIARRLDIPTSEIGMAGLKDRRAVTRQWISVPESAEPRLASLEGDGIRLLQTSRHDNKLRSGHLHGNRFTLLIRDALSTAPQLLPPLLDRFRQHGLPNYYGLQRFGKDAETLQLGFDLLNGKPTRIRNSFLKKLALSAAQSGLFNHYLGQRLHDGLLRTVLLGDVMAKVPFGGMFTAVEVAVEQERFDRREIVSAGPIFGRKTFPALQDAAAREAVILEAAGLTERSFQGFGKLMQGTRRHNLVYVQDLDVQLQEQGVQLTFSLPAGSYATILLREIMKADVPDDDPPLAA